MTNLSASTRRFFETMSRLTYFQNWPTDILDRLAAGTKLVTLGKNDSLAQKGSQLEHLYVMVSGMVRLFIPLPNACERVVALVGPGESLGEACLVLNEACPFNVVAGRPSHLLAIDAHLFRRELNQNHELAKQTMELIARRHLEALRDAEICAQRSSLNRVACFLLQQQPDTSAQRYDFDLPARKQDIAAKLGLTQETFSRMLGFLQKQGFIRVEGSHIHVEDGSALNGLGTMREAKESVQ